MHLFNVAVTSLLLSLSVLSASAKPKCDYSQCSPLQCADPDLALDPCCGDCSQSQCVFEGCVIFGPFSPSWRPSTCEICTCIKGEKDCTNLTKNCPKTECYGVTRQGECCPECDYGAPKNECWVVPMEEETLTVSFLGKTCELSIRKHGCDKSTVILENLRRGCSPVEDLVSVLVDVQDCGGVQQVLLQLSDTVSCSIEQVVYDYSDPLSAACIPVA